LSDWAKPAIHAYPTQSQLIRRNSIDQIARKTSHTLIDLHKRWESMNIILHIMSLLYLRRYNAVFKLVPDSIAYFGYCKLPSKSAFFLLIYLNHFFNNVYIRRAFKLNKIKGR